MPDFGFAAFWGETDADVGSGLNTSRFTELDRLFQGDFVRDRIDNANRFSINYKAACGSPNYVAPELLKKDGMHQGTDVWSMGVTFYVMANRDYPFQGDHPDDIRSVLRDVLHKQPLKGHMPNDLEGLIFDMLDKNPARRPEPLEILGRLAHQLQ